MHIWIFFKFLINTIKGLLKELNNLDLDIERCKVHCFEGTWTKKDTIGISQDLGDKVHELKCDFEWGYYTGNMKISYGNIPNVAVMFYKALCETSDTWVQK